MNDAPAGTTGAAARTTTTAGHPADSPVLADAPKEDRIDTALLAMAAAAAASVTWFSLLTWVQSHLVEGSRARTIAQVNPNSPDVNFLVYGTVVGLGLTGVTAWLLLRPVPSTYRRGALAMVSALAGTTLAMTATWLGYQLAGRTALVVLAMVSITIAVLLARWSSVKAR